MTKPTCNVAEFDSTSTVFLEFEGLFGLPSARSATNLVISVRVAFFTLPKRISQHEPDSNGKVHQAESRISPSPFQFDR
jgi:hypothetical protein